MESEVEVEVTLPVGEVDNRLAWRKAAARALGIAPGRIAETRLRRRSIDARRPPVRFRLRLWVGVDAALPPEPELRYECPALPERAPRVVIVGSGPAGLFAALRCIELGVRPVVVERGKDVARRRFDLAPLLRKGRVVEDSNYCFGEGGAGTFSDGKLYTRANKRGPVRTVYEILVIHGAPGAILTDAHPHIGSNLLPRVVRALRESILGAGGEVHFEARVDELLASRERRRIAGVATADGREFRGKAVILATGHSARDVLRLLLRHGLRLEAKPFAMGVRVEHPQPVVDAIQYHLPRGGERPRQLPAARYRLATVVERRSVHSFCMCPGGFIVPCATGNDEVVVNGMSLSRRDSPFANSGIVVGLEPEDTNPWQAEYGVLAGVAMQKELERAAKSAGGGGQRAPAQRLMDYLRGRGSGPLPATSYFPGVREADLDELLPAGLSTRLREGLKRFGRSMPGFLCEEALLVGFETRTSSPVRVPRHPETLEHPDLGGLFPCGEGAGFAGGIVSAALDGRNCAEAAAGFLGVRAPRPSPGPRPP